MAFTKLFYYLYQSANVRIGYVSTNYSIGCDADKTIRLTSLSPEKVMKVSLSNLDCLKRILEWNINHNIFFFRISSNTIPFASHPRLNFDWREKFEDILTEIGDFIKENSIRVSMHPGQYVVINSDRAEVVKSSEEELKYHVDLLDLMKVEGYVQIHVGSSRGGKETALNRFILNFQSLPLSVRNRIAIENDDRIFTVNDCMWISARVKVPVVLDNLHHSLNNDGESFQEALEKVRKTWNARPMIDYSEQEPGEKPGVHASTLNEENFRKFVENIEDNEIDIMLEIKDKEKSALKAVNILKELGKLD